MILKVKAGALQLTMFVVVVIALLLAAFIILISTHKRFNIQTHFVLETIDKTNMGVNLILHNNISLNDTVEIDLKDESYKTLKVCRDYWGVFEKVVSSSKVKTKAFKKIALIGAQQSKIERTALYVEENNKPLVLVGNTEIQGVVYLPKQGVRTGNISGHSYYGSQLVYGPMKESGKLPKILDETIGQINAIQKRSDLVDLNEFINLKDKKTYQNSFFNPLQVIYSKEDIILSDISLTGHILVQSETKIIVEASSTLKDVILIAPQIDINDNLKGTFQAIATKGISVGENCDLNYPSALVLKETIENIKSNEGGNYNTKTPFITVKKGSHIKGVIVYLGDTKNYNAQIFIDEDVNVIGEVYCNQNLELLGKVYGSVFTSNFVANQSGASYQNHIYNGAILIDGLPNEYVGLCFENSKKGIMKWLY